MKRVIILGILILFVFYAGFVYGIVDDEKSFYQFNVSQDIEEGIVERDIEAFLPKFEGYIIQFEDEPVLVKKVRLEKEMKELNKKIEDATPVIGAIPNLFRKSSRSSKQRGVASLDDYREELKQKQKDILSGAFVKLSPEYKEGLIDKIKKVFSKKKQIQLSPEFEDKIQRGITDVFNGISLDISAEEAEEFKKIKGVKEVYPNYEVRALLMDSVPLIGADRVWQLDKDGNNCVESGGECLTGKGVKIAIIDTGVDYTHPDLGGCSKEQFHVGQCQKIIGGFDIINWDIDPMDDQGHGTHVAATAAGNGDWDKDGIVEAGEGLNGVAPDAKILAYKVLDAGGSGSTETVLWGIEKAVQDDVDIISLSLGGGGNPDDPLSQAVDNAVSVGVVVIVAAGNDGPNKQTIGSPGTARQAITVGATYKKDYETTKWDSPAYKDHITRFSSRGPVIWTDEQGREQVLAKPDVVAPGAIICAARYDNIFPEGYNPYYKPCLDDKHVQMAGTSMATPIVSGAVALLKQGHPDWNPEQIKFVLKESSIKSDDNPFIYGAGRLNIFKAVSHQLITIDGYTKIESPGGIKGSFDIKGRIKLDGFIDYKIEIAHLTDNLNFETIYESSILPSDEYLARNIPLPSLYGENILRLTVRFKDGQSVRYAYLFNRKGKNFELMDGWPVKPFDWPKGFWGVGSTPIIVDINNDGLDEIIVRESEVVSVLDYKGKNLPGWPKYTSMGMMSNGPIPPVSVGDIDGDGELEIFADNVFANVVKDNKLCGYAWESDGSTVDGWSNDCYACISYLDCPTKDYYVSQKFSILSDIDNDGKQEIILLVWRALIDDSEWMEPENDVEMDPYLHKNEIGVFIFDGSSNVRIGWPVLYTYYRWNDFYVEEYDEFDNPFSIFITDVAVTDIDNDGKQEIIMLLEVTDLENKEKLFKVQIFNADGVLKKEFDSKFSEKLIIADINNDNLKEIGVSRYSIFFYDLNGDIVNNWQFQDGYQKNYFSVSQLVDKINIIFNSHVGSSDRVSVLEENGKYKQGWPQQTDGIGLWVTPQVADINGDGKLEIMTTTDSGFLYAWDENGNLLEEFPIKFGWASNSGTAIGDIDKDGFVELVAGLHDGVLYAWKFNKPYFKNNGEWPMIYYNSQNTAVYEKYRSCTSDADCNDNNVCNGIETCLNEVCQKGDALNCDDGLFCNGLDMCDAELGCVSGTEIDCSANGVFVSQCDYMLDGNSATFDLFAGFTSVCDEDLDACSEIYDGWEEDITHECSKEKCSAECENNQDCDDGNPATVDICLSDCSCESVVECIDSDINGDYPDGQNFYLKGQTCIGEECYNDECSWGFFINEYYCDEFGAIKSIKNMCLIGCTDGACKPVKGCTEENDDGLDYYSYGGDIYEGTLQRQEFCTGDVLTEFYCDYEGHISSKEFECPSLCGGFICKWVDEVCVDSDVDDVYSDGKNYGLKGIARDGEDNNDRYEDSCQSETEVKEYYCDAGEVYSEIHECPSGCNKGICKPASICSDGTESTQCSIEKPKYCQDGELVDNCQVCGCDEGYECGEDGRCLEQILPECGNGIQEGDEECDDGNEVNDDDCKNDCSSNICGDDVKHINNEECDGIDDEACPSLCQEDCSCETSECPEDVNKDGKINVLDLIIVRNKQGSSGCNIDDLWCEGTDINQDGKVNILDLVIVRDAQGKDCLQLSPPENIFEKVWGWFKGIFS